MTSAVVGCWVLLARVMPGGWAVDVSVDVEQVVRPRAVGVGMRELETVARN